MAKQVKQTKEVEEVEIEKVAEEVAEKPNMKYFTVGWMNDFEHFNKDYGFISKKPEDGPVEIFIKDDSGRYQWYCTEVTDERLDWCIENCSARVRF